LAEVSTSRDKLADAERKKDEADCELAKAESALSHLRDAEADIRAKLSSRLIFKQAVDLALQQDEVKQKLADAAKELNLPEAGAAGTELKNELLEVRGLGGAIALAMRNTEKLRTWVLAFVLLAGSLFIIYRWALPWALGHGLPDLVGHLVAIVAGITALISPFLNKARRALGLLQEARTRSEKIIKDEQDKQRDQLQKDRYQKAKAVEQQEKAVDQARSKVDQLEQKLRDLRVDRQMFDFIKRRNESTDYTRHLGVIARAHKDFRELSTLLQQVKSAPAMDLPRVERIVLYIDDLDRCPENKVMDVLQAVHLLLAFPLFVVVVGVDPRWLLHSVSEHSPAFRRRSTEAAPFSEDHRLLWQSTPLNYLEKIFQVPFTLTPMTEGGFKNLVEELAKPNKEWIKGTPETIHADKVPQVGETGQVEKAKGASATQSGLDDKDDAKADQARKREAPSPPDPSPEPLRIEEWEREFMKRLYSLIPSPRSGKKFINLYRMVRATVDPAKWQEFVGSKDGGDHRAVLVMLAILIGYPSEGAVIFRRLLERRRNETWWEFIQSLEPRAGEMRETSGWAEFRTRLESLHELVADTEGCDVFREYAQRVARYSFQSGRVLLAAHLPDTED
jgi:hypothetical protein